VKAPALLVALAALTLCACNEAPTANPLAPQAKAPAPAPAPAARSTADFPALSGRVVDRAELLTPAQEAALSRDLEALERRTTDQMVIVTVPSLGGRDIAEYGRALGTHWGIGQRGKDNGLLLIVAPNERQARVALGLGIARIVSDARAQAIMDQLMIPRFREGQYHAGIRAATQVLIAELIAREHEPRRGRP
jgi:uncharacterized protein